MNPAVAMAYSHCERVTRERARNFYYGIRLLPARKRASMCAVYAMARRVDDVGDGPLGLSATTTAERQSAVEREARLAALAEIRTSLTLLSRGTYHQPAVPPGDPVLVALADTAERFPLPVEALVELVEGCEWDVSGRSYRTFDELAEYCRRVAGAVGRLALGIYEPSDQAAAEPLADALGIALQLTNILRDIVEDRDVMGRVYLPEEDLARFDIGPRLDGREEDLVALICFETARATQWFERGLSLLPLLDRRSRACTATMAGIYHRLLDRIRWDPAAVLRGHMSLSPIEKAGVAAKALAGGAL
ncbi:MAG: phytoene/squalene synthase family protein [Acidimicrobiales bacterium]